MLEAIVDFLNLNLQLLNYFEKRHCLSTLVKTDKGMVYPAEYVSKGNYNAIDFDAFDGVSYIRLTNDISFDRIDNKYTPSPRINITFPLRVVFSVGKDKLSVDDAYSFDRVRASIAKQLESDPLDLTTQLKADNVVITTGDYIEDAKTLWDEETAETGQYQPKYEVVFGALEVTVTVTIKKECIPAECDNFESDILRTFDFCKPAIQQRLTEAQQTCLSDWLCTPTPCDDATVTLNGVTMTTIPAGDTENILVLQSNDMTQVGSKQGTHWRIDDSDISINGTFIDSVKAEDSLDIDVTQGGSPVGSWNGSAWIIPPCSAPSLAITFYSDAGLTTPITTANYGQTIYINAVATGVTPTEYRFDIEGNITTETTTQSGATLTWSVDTLNPIVSVTANDGTDYAANTATITVNQDAIAAAFVTRVETNTSDTVAGRQRDAINLLCWMLRGNNTTNSTDLITLFGGTNTVIYPCLPNNDSTAYFDAFKVDLLNLVEGSYVNMVAGDITTEGVVGGTGKKFNGNIQPADFDINSVMVHQYVSSFGFPAFTSGVHITNQNSIGLSCYWIHSIGGTILRANTSEGTFPGKRTFTGILSYGRIDASTVGVATNGLHDGASGRPSVEAIAHDMCWHGFNNATTDVPAYTNNVRLAGYAMTPWLTADQYLDFCEAWQAFNDIVIPNGRRASIGD